MRTIQSVRIRVGQAECFTCHEFWPLNTSFFRKDERNSDGFRHQCRSCEVDKWREHREKLMAAS